MDITEKNQEIFKKDDALKKVAEAFIIGQGKLYVLEKRNKISKDGSIVFNGPAFTERSWNSRPLKQSSVQELAQINGGRIYPTIQEYAIVVAISESLLEESELAAYNSHEFPNISFKDTPGEIHIVNGHHRIEALILKHKQLLEQYHRYQKLLKGVKVASDHDSQEIIDGRENLKRIEDTLLDDGGWGAIILNYGKCYLLFIESINNRKLDAIMRSNQQAEIKAYWARNVDHFHLADSPSDLLQLILKSVQTMSEEEGYSFLEYQLNRTTASCQAKIASILKNPQLLRLFSNLTKWPMFEAAKLINFNQIYLWRKIVPCFLEVFLDYAQATYSYLASPVGSGIHTILDVKIHQDLQLAYPLFNVKFHEIIDEAYKAHLVPSFLAFGAPGGSISAGSDTVIDWTNSFEKYRTEIVDNLTFWASENSQATKYHAELGVFIERLKYILDDAYKVYPMISNLKIPIPLASSTFIQDVASDLFSVQDAIIEVSFC